MTHLRERHIWKHNVNIDLVMSPELINLNLSINLVSNCSSNFLFFFSGSLYPVWSTCNLLQITAQPLQDVLSNAEPLNPSVSNISSRLCFSPLSTCGDLESLEVTPNTFWWRKWIFVTLEEHQRAQFHLKAVSVAFTALVLNVCFVLICQTAFCSFFLFFSFFL